MMLDFIFPAPLYGSLLMGSQNLLNYTLFRIGHSVPFVVHVSCPTLYIVSCRNSTVGLGIVLFLSALFLEERRCLLLRGFLFERLSNIILSLFTSEHGQSLRHANSLSINCLEQCYNKLSWRKMAVETKGCECTHNPEHYHPLLVHRAWVECSE
jgi:hypothetical protein